jgi:hypothetical protein
MVIIPVRVFWGGMCALAMVGGCTKPDASRGLEANAKTAAAAAAADTSPRAMSIDFEGVLRKTPMPTTISTTLSREIRTAGFSLRVPESATIDTGAIHPENVRGLRIRGPVMRDSSGIEGVVYELAVREYPNPGGTPLNHWVDSVRKAHNAPLTKDDDFMTVPAATVFHAGRETGLLVDFFCGDCGSSGLFVAKDRTILGFYFTSAQGRAISQLQQDRMAIHILDSFRWRP